MGISRSSVNHGIMELENMGFLSITPRRGTVVNDYRTHPTPQSLAAASGNSVYSMIYRGFETVLCTLIRQHYSMRSEDVKESAQLHGQLLDAIIRKDEQNAQELARKILTQGITVLQGRYS